MMVVTLLKAYASNNAGEVCGFEDDVATALVARGWAALYVTAAVPSAPVAAVALPPVQKVVIQGQPLEVAPNITADAKELRRRRKG